MLLSFILALILGIFCGIISGLTPGIHINLVSALLVSSLAFFLTLTSPIILVVFIVSMTITHTFLDFIPSIFLGAPDEDSVLSVLPGHEMLNKGKGYEAIILVLYGCILGIFLVLILTPLFLIFLPLVFQYLNIIMFFILVLTNLYLIFQDSSSKFLALFVFLLSGFLGLVTLNLNMNDSLLPLLTGLFGSSSLITSIIKKQKIPEQEIKKLKEIKITKKEISSAGLGAILSAPLCSFLPALGTGQAAVIGSNITGEQDRRKFLILLGAVNTLVSGLSFIAVYSIQKARTGTSVALQKIIENFTFSNLLVILLVIFIASIISFFLVIFIARFFSRKISSFDYRKLSTSILIFLSIIVLIISGFLGFILFIISTATGLVGILLGVRRTNLMGSLMLPAILLYLPF